MYHVASLITLSVSDISFSWSRYCSQISLNELKSFSIISSIAAQLINNYSIWFIWLLQIPITFDFIIVTSSERWLGWSWINKFVFKLRFLYMKFLKSSITSYLSEVFSGLLSIFNQFSSLTPYFISQCCKKCFKPYIWPV